ncbi:MAG: rhodanese-like domain-containing protein [Bacteroidaceae bacterium]
MLKSIFLKTIFGSALFLLACNPHRGSYERVQTDEFALLISDTLVLRVDVRTAEEYAKGHIPGAINIDFLKEDFLSQALSILPQNHTVALYCASGKRSRKAAGILCRQGYHVVELKGGYQGWKKAKR